MADRWPFTAGQRHVQKDVEPLAQTGLETGVGKNASLRRKSSRRQLLQMTAAGGAALAAGTMPRVRHAAGQAEARLGEAPPSGLRLTLLGTGSPFPDPRRYGASQVVQVGDALVLIDAGVGVVHRLVEAGYRSPKLRHIALTHLHSDHSTGLASLLWAGWNFHWWDEPPVLSGPPGTADLVAYLLKAYAQDIDVRVQTQGLDRALLQPRVVEMAPDYVATGDGWQLSAFVVHHEPVNSAFGFRLDADAGSIVISGDTRPSQNLVEHALGVDLLVHEVFKQPNMPPPRAPLGMALNVGAVLAGPGSVLDYHTHSDEVGKVADAAEVKQLVLSHIVTLMGATDAGLRAEVGRDYSGALVVGADLQVFNVGSQP